jgi:hypothetical protein
MAVFWATIDIARHRLAAEHRAFVLFAKEAQYSNDETTESLSLLLVKTFPRDDPWRKFARLSHNDTVLMEDEVQRSVSFFS